MDTVPPVIPLYITHIPHYSSYRQPPAPDAGPNEGDGPKNEEHFTKAQG